MRSIGLNAAPGREGALAAHLQNDGTTLCNLLKITARDGSVLGLTSLDRDVIYDDGAGAVTYQAPIGFDHSSIDSGSDLGVDNSEALILLADSGAFTRQKIEAGLLDFARFVAYRVNYQDLDAGHYILPGGAGYTGIVRAVERASGVIELRGLSQWAKQNFVPLYSKTCRASLGGHQCGVDVSALWVAGTVDTVSSEPDRVFSATAAPVLSGYTFVPGLVEWLTGNNAGKFSEVEAVSGVNIELLLATRFDIQPGDTYRIRPDCDKTKATCRDVFNNLSMFRGEADIPLGDESNNATPGAGSYPLYPGAVTEFSEETETVGDVVTEPTLPDTLVGTESVFARFEKSGLYSKNSIRTSSIDFVAAGYTRDMIVVVSGAGVNDGTYEIIKVYTDSLWIRGEISYDPGVSCTLSFYQ